MKDINLKYWEVVVKEIFNDRYAKVGFKVVTGMKSFKPVTCWLYTLSFSR